MRGCWASVPVRGPLEADGSEYPPSGMRVLQAGEGHGKAGSGQNCVWDGEEGGSSLGGDLGMADASARSELPLLGMKPYT